MGAPLSPSVMFSTNLTDDPKEFESLEKELQNMQISTHIDLHPSLEHLKNRPPKGDRDPDTGGYIPPTEYFIYISIMYEMLATNLSVLDLIQFTAKQLITNALSFDGLGHIKVEIKISLFNNIHINIGRTIVISDSTTADKAADILQDEFEGLKEEAKDLEKQKDED